MRNLLPLCLLLVSLFSAECLGQAQKEQLPNIVLILADDLGIGDIGAYNPDSKVPTPHMDRLAREGRRFNDAHSPSAVCTPTRYGVLTGRYSWRTRLKSGVLWGYSPALIDTERETLATLLKRKGYATGAVGKWHLGLGRGKTDYSKRLEPSPVDYGFDYFFGIPASLDMEPYVYVENNRAVEEPTETVEHSQHRRRDGGGFWRGGPVAPGFKHDEVLPKSTEKAVAFIKERAEDGETPFFLYLPYSAPHTPWLPTDEFRGKSGASYYGDFVNMVDHNVGQVLKALDENGLTENTIVIMTSDNGSHWPRGDVQKYSHEANLGYRGQKADIWEAGHRVPFIVRWPGKAPAGSESDETLSLTDFIATFAAVTGQELDDDAGEDSYDMLPAILGNDLEEPIRRSIVHHSLHGTFAIRVGDWKLIEGLGSGGFTAPRNVEPEPDGPQGQLYNLAEDPQETKNLWQERPEVVERLSLLLDLTRDLRRSR